MKNNQLNRVISIITRTGEKALVMDKETDEVMVIMSLNKYEELLDDAEPVHFLEEETEDDDALSEKGAFPWEAVSSGEELEMPEILKPKAPRMAVDRVTLDFVDDWTAESKRASNLGESLADVPNEEEEEKFYLEPVE